MSQGAEQLVVRQHERFHCRLPSKLRVAEDATEQVTLARVIGDGSGAVEAFVTDASRGGLGIESNVFFPRGCRMKIRVRPTAAAGAPETTVLVRVQRVTMLDRTPTYYLGASYVSQGPEHEQCVAALIEMARQAQVAPPSAPIPAPASGASGKGGR